MAEQEDIEIFTKSALGSGSYGLVCKARIGLLPCAAKLLHPILFDAKDPNCQDAIIKFQQECEFMSSVQHPNIVQYLGMFRQPTSGMPVLLMEMMDENLTDYLEKQIGDIPFHTQVNLCRDITLAIVYLHAHDIIHRDLSSNNVLLLTGCRAKVGDFGMSRLVDANPRFATQLTQCPGCAAYMPPEALQTPPLYTKKLDCFSFGVLAIQILTQQFPSPTASIHLVKDAQYPTGVIQVPIPEKERRLSHIELIDPQQPLLEVALKCLEYEENKRPSAHDMCQSISQMQESERYRESKDKARDRQLVILKEVETQEKHPGRQGNKELLLPQEELATAKNEILSLHAHAKQNEKLIQQLQMELAQLKSTSAIHLGSNRSDENVPKHGYETIKSAMGTGTIQCESHSPKDIQWKGSTTSLPKRIARGASVVKGRNAYFSAKGLKEIYEYDSENDKCSKLPDCPSSDYGLEIVNGLLTTVGGWQAGRAISSLFTLSETKNGKEWLTTFPNMPTRRCHPAVVCTEKYLVVAGGETKWWGGEKLSQVELMCIESLQWYSGASLPEPVSSMTAAMCAGNLYLLGGLNQTGTNTNMSFRCSILSLVQDLKAVQQQSSGFRIAKRTLSGGKRRPDSTTSEPDIWYKCATVPVYAATAASFCGHLLAIGGCNSNETPTTVIHSYESERDMWDPITSLPNCRSFSLVAAMGGGKLVVAGGYSARGVASLSDTIDIGVVQ